MSSDALDETDSGHWKQRQHPNYTEKIQRIQDHGISVNGCFAFGFDSDTSDTFDDTRKFIEESGLSEVQLTLLTPFPGTELFHQMQKSGRLLKETFWDECTLFDLVFEPKNFSVSELETEFRSIN